MSRRWHHSLIGDYMHSLLMLLQEPSAAAALNNNALLGFGILLFLAWRLGYPELLKMVEERERRIQKQLDDAETANAEAQRLLEEHKKQIAAARTEAQEILAKAKNVAQKEREVLLTKARE